MAKVIGYIKAVAQNKNGYYAICVANQNNKDGVWLNFNVKEPNYKGVELVKGTDVEAEYDDNKFNTVSSLIKKEKNKNNSGYQKGGNSSSGGKANGSYQKRDNTGVEVGHSVNGAFYATKFSKMDVVDEAKHVHDVTTKLKLEYAAAHPTMSEYDAGAAVGNAVLNGCKLIGSSGRVKLADLEKIAKQILAKVVPNVLEYVQASKEAPEKEEQEEEFDFGGDEQQEEAPEPAPEPQKTKGKPGRKPAAKQPEPAPELDGFEDEDLPF